MAMGTLLRGGVGSVRRRFRFDRHPFGLARRAVGFSDPPVCLVGPCFLHDLGSLVEATGGVTLH